MPPMTVEKVITNALVGHIDEHVESIRKIDDGQRRQRPETVGERGHERVHDRVERADQLLDRGLLSVGVERELGAERRCAQRQPAAEPVGEGDPDHGPRIGSGRRPKLGGRAQFDLGQRLDGGRAEQGHRRDLGPDGPNCASTTTLQRTSKLVFNATRASPFWQLTSIGHLR